MRGTLLFLVLGFVLLAVAPLRAEKRAALVIGNSAYEHAAPLRNPRNDAKVVSDRLKELGFDVIMGIDMKHRDFARTIAAFKRKLEHASVAVFFYAGHGLQVNGRNFLAPVDALLDDETSLDFEAVQLRTILRLMERRRRTNLVFLDACRDNPLARNLARSMGIRSGDIGRGLAREETGVGTMIAFATQPGNVALDGEQANSPFTSALVSHIGTPGLDVALMMRRVRQDVIDATGGRQVPWQHSSLTAPFLFKEKADPSRQPTVKRPVVPGIDSLAIELAFWQAAKDADTKQAYKAYLKKYPKGNFAPLVAIKLEEFALAESRAEQQKAALEAARREREDAERATREAEAAKSAKRAAEERRRAEKEAALRKAEAEDRRQELEALKRKQAEERERLASERDALAERLKALEDAAKKRAAEAAKQKPIEKSPDEPAAEPQQLAALDPAPGSPAEPALDAYTMVLVLQNELKRVGCDPGKVDGKWGPQGRRALASFNKHAKLTLPTNEPTMEALSKIKALEDRVCPLTCGVQYRIQGDQCVKKTCRSGQRLNSRGQCVRVVVKKAPVKVTPKKPAPRVEKEKSAYRKCRDAGFGYAACRGRN